MAGKPSTKRQLKLDMSLPGSVMSAKPQILKDPKATTRWIIVTPELATRWLEENNWNNRPVRDSYVTRLASDMRTGKWKGQNGEAIRFDTAGRLVDGQHRLWASVVSQCRFETLLVEGVDPEDYATIGTGATKVLRDFLGPMGGEKNVHLLSSAIRLVYMWERNLLNSLKDGKKMPTITELQEVLERHPRLRDSADWVANHPSVRKLIVPSFAALLHYAGTKEGHPATVESFLERLGTGVGLDAQDPVYQLRQFLEKQRGVSPGHRRTGKEYVLGVAIKAWNLSKCESKLKTSLRIRIDEDFPTLLGLKESEKVK